MSKLRKCPFCKQEVNADFPYLYKNENCGWILSHYCKTKPGVLSTTIDIYADTREEAIDLWNGEYHAEEQTSEGL